MHVEEKKKRFLSRLSCCQPEVAFNEFSVFYRAETQCDGLSDPTLSCPCPLHLFNLNVAR